MIEQIAQNLDVVSSYCGFRSKDTRESRFHALLLVPAYNHWAQRMGFATFKDTHDKDVLRERLTLMAVDVSTGTAKERWAPLSLLPLEAKYTKQGMVVRPSASAQMGVPGNLELSREAQDFYTIETRICFLEYASGVMLAKKTRKNAWSLRSITAGFQPDELLAPSREYMEREDAFSFKINPELL